MVGPHVPLAHALVRLGEVPRAAGLRGVLGRGREAAERGGGALEVVVRERIEEGLALVACEHLRGLLVGRLEQHLLAQRPARHSVISGAALRALVLTRLLGGGRVRSLAVVVPGDGQRCDLGHRAQRRHRVGRDADEADALPHGAPRAADVPRVPPRAAIPGGGGTPRLTSVERGRAVGKLLQVTHLHVAHAAAAVEPWAHAHGGGVARDEGERLVVLEGVGGLVPGLRRLELATPVGCVALANEAVGHHARRLGAAPPAGELELLAVICLDLEPRAQHVLLPVGEAMREHVAHVAEDDEVPRRDALPCEGLEEGGRAATGRRGAVRHLAAAEGDHRVLPLLDLEGAPCEDVEVEGARRARAGHDVAGWQPREESGHLLASRGVVPAEVVEELGRGHEVHEAVTSQVHDDLAPVGDAVERVGVLPQRAAVLAVTRRHGHRGRAAEVAALAALAAAAAAARRVEVGAAARLRGRLVALYHRAAEGRGERPLGRVPPRQARPEEHVAAVAAAAAALLSSHLLPLNVLRHGLLPGAAATLEGLCLLGRRRHRQGGHRGVQRRGRGGEPGGRVRSGRHGRHGRVRRVGSCPRLQRRLRRRRRREARRCGRRRGPAVAPQGHLGHDLLVQRLGELV